MHFQTLTIILAKTNKNIIGVLCEQHVLGASYDLLMWRDEKNVPQLFCFHNLGTPCTNYRIGSTAV